MVLPGPAAEAAAALPEPAAEAAAALPEPAAEATAALPDLAAEAAAALPEPVAKAVAVQPVLPVFGESELPARKKARSEHRDVLEPSQTRGMFKAMGY